MAEAENIVEFTDGNFQVEVLDADEPVLVDFWAPWCMPCLQLAPLIEELADDYAGRARVGKVNIDDNRDVAVKYGIDAIPTVLVFKGGQIVKMLQGLSGKEQFTSVLDEQLG